MAVLMTGSERYDGSSLLPRLRDFPVVTVDRRPAAQEDGRLSHITADLAHEAERLRQELGEEMRFEGLIHLAANPNPSVPWERLYEDNVLGTLRAYDLARDLGIRAVVFASSVHVVDGYSKRPEMGPVKADDPAWPTNAYGISKIVGESFLQMLCDELPAIGGYALRIGAYWDQRGPLHRRTGADVMFLHADDFADIVARCLRADRVGYHRLFCTSGVARPVVDLSDTKRLLGYEPRHTAEDYFGS
jgi:nucleoside-diphosphate-sugar epimerase